MGFTNTSLTTFDDDIGDQLRQGLYTDSWAIHGSLDHCECKEGECVKRGRCKGRFFSMIFVNTLHSVKNARSLELPGEACCTSFQEMPPTSDVLGVYYDYFRTNVLDMVKGESLVNLCTSDFKSPCFDIRNCILARRTTPPPHGYTFLHRSEHEYWVLLMPSTRVDVVFEALHYIDIIPVPGVHDANAYNSSRLTAAGSIATKIMPPGSWRTPSYEHVVTRYVECDAVATATFTVTIILTRFSKAQGSHTHKRNVEFVVHNVK